MIPALSVVLPVNNAEQTLAGSVLGLLELLPDLAERFEVLIVDDGSLDHTAEIAHELAQRYPQLRLTRHAYRRGMAAAVQTGIASTRGEFILVHDEREPLSPRDVRRLWNMRHDPNLVVARALPEVENIESGLLARLMHWGRAVQQASAHRPLATATQLIRRAAVRELETNPARDRGLSIARADGAEKITPRDSAPAIGRDESTTRFCPRGIMRSAALAASQPDCQLLHYVVFRSETQRPRTAMPDSLSPKPVPNAPGLGFAWIMAILGSLSALCGLTFLVPGAVAAVVVIAGVMAGSAVLHFFVWGRWFEKKLRAAAAAEEAAAATAEKIIHPDVKK